MYFLGTHLHNRIRPYLKCRQRVWSDGRSNFPCGKPITVSPNKMSVIGRLIERLECIRRPGNRKCIFYTQHVVGGKHQLLFARQYLEVVQ